MWQNKRFVLVAILIAVILSGCILGISCSSTGDKDTQPPSTSQNARSPEGMPPGPDLSEDLLAKLAETLGIDQQKLADAFAQAQSELAPTIFGDNQTPSAPQNTTPPEGMPVSRGLSKDLLARVAEILGIDQQTFEDTFAEVQSKIPAGATPPTPNQQ